MGIVVGFAAALALFGVAALYAWWVTWCTDNIEKTIPSLIATFGPLFIALWAGFAFEFGGAG